MRAMDSALAVRDSPPAEGAAAIASRTAAVNRIDGLSAEG